MNNSKSIRENIISLGVDIGGTNIKFAVLSGREILYKSIIPTNISSAEDMLSDIEEEYKKIKKEYPIEKMGVGVPGIIKNGRVSAANLHFDYVPLEEMLKVRFKEIPVKLENDANCAALAESRFGAGEKYQNIVVVTLGTGVGGGIIMEKAICPGNKWMGEVGHMIVQAEGGLPCKCGMDGCWEQYASATALIRQGAAAAEENKKSILYKKYKENGFSLNGKLIFDALDEGCSVAEKVLDVYSGWLAVGIKSIAQVLAPDAIVLAGGVTAQKEKLLKPLMEKLSLKDVQIEISILQNDAGAMGAAVL